MSSPACSFAFQPHVAPSVPPRSQPLSRLQLLRVMRTNMLESYGAEAYRQLTFCGPFFGRKSLLTSDPAMVRHVLVDHADRYGRTVAARRILRPLLGDGLFLSEGADWKFQRRTLAPAFTPRAMDLVARATVPIAEAQFENLATSDGSVDLLRPIQAIALEVAGRAMFSTAMDQRGPGLRRIFEQYGRSLGRPYPLDILLPGWLPSPHDMARKMRSRRWLAYIQAMVDARNRLPEDDDVRDLFDLMAKSVDPETGRQFGARELRDQFATFIIAGHETTALSLLWALILLARAPDIQDAVAAEAAQMRLSADNASAAFAKLTLTRAVVQETLRLFPPAFLIVREVVDSDVVAGHTLRKGDVVSISPWVMHRHEMHWDRPDHFDPGRFLPDAPTPAKYTYLPFGAGPRICIGAQFALTEAALVLAVFLSRYRVALDDIWSIRPRAVVTTYPDPVPLFEVSPRLS